ncbi:MAG: ankyrin repeat domain-containing protein [Pyrinomonadaceae bacterium]
MKNPLIFASVVVFFLAAPNKIEGQKRSAATPTVESSVNAFFRHRVTTESGGALSPAGFRKTNGYEQGYGIYVMEWQGEVLFHQDGYKAGDFFVGYWQNFRVLQQKPGTLDSLIVGNTILFTKGTTVRLIGNATLRKTEKGWRLEGFEVKTSQVLAKPKVATPRQPLKPMVTPASRIPPETVLMDAATKGDVTTVRTLLAKGADINANDKSYAGTALIKAAIGGHLAVVQLLLAKGANTEAKGGGGQTALIDAASGGHIAVVQALLAKGADVDAVNGRALREAALFGHLPVVEALLAKGADVNAGDETALIAAADRGHLAIVQALLAKGADANKKGGGRGATALIHAVATLDKGRAGGTSGDVEEPGGSLPIVQALLDQGVDMDAKDLSGWTALMYAAGDGHLAIVQALVAKGANIEAKGEDGWTALMSAAESGRLTLVRALLA